MPDAELFTTYTEVKPEWIDYNGHMNMGYYLVAFDYIATDEGYLAATNECLGMYIDLETRRSASFSDEQMSRFQQELARGRQLPLAEEFGRKLEIRR